MGIFDFFASPRQKAARAIAEQKKAASATLDAALAQRREGAASTTGQFAECADAFNTYYELLSRFHGTQSNLEFPDEDGADFYLLTLKLAALGHPDHSAWPLMSDLRKQVLPTLRARMDTSDDPWLFLAAIQPALLARELTVAQECHARIKNDPFLSKLAIGWAQESLIGFSSYNRVEPAKAFLASVPHTEPWNEAAPDVPTRWTWLASIFPPLTFDPRTTLADARPRPATWSGLKNDWGILDRPKAREIVKWLMHEGHRKRLAEDIETGASDSKSRAEFVAANRKALEAHKILAWDLGRLVAVARAAFACGYLDEASTTEALRKAGNLLRETYSSWEELGDDYILGRTYFSPGSIEKDIHIATIRWMQRDGASPWKLVPFGG